MKSQWAFTVRGEGSSTLEIDIYDVIGDDWFGGVSAREIRRRMKAAKDVDTIRVRINSLGGDVFDGLAIHNLLADSPAKVEIDIDGVAASMASAIAMAGDEIRIAKAAYLMIHNPWGFAVGESEDMRKHADLLDKLGDTLGGIYSRKTGLAEDEIRAMMAAETWLNADEAFDQGFVTRVTEKAAEQKSKAASKALRAFAAARLEGFKNLPDALRELAAQSPAPAEEPEPKTTPDLDGPAKQPPIREEEDMNKIPEAVLKALKLSEDSDEATVLGAIEKLRASAHAGCEIEKLVGCTGAEAIGAVRALKKAKEDQDELRAEVEKLKASGSRRDFEALIKLGCDEKKLSPAEAKHYSERFEKDLENGGDGATIVDDLRGWLKVASKKVGNARRQPGTGNEQGAMQHEGKAFEDMNGAERHRLKTESPELYETLRNDAVDRGAL